MTEDPYYAGRLIQWGLRGSARPAQEEEYRELLEKYLEQSEFQELTREFARGLGLKILDAGKLGLVLGTLPDSSFAYKPSDFRSTTRADDRLFDGLIQIAIAATVFPRSADLEEDPSFARPPVRSEEVDATLRGICDGLGQKAKSEPDPEMAGIYEAWRVYQQRPLVKETLDDRAAYRGTRRLIETAFDRLTEFGCFTKHDDGYQPTWKYQVQVRELAAQNLWMKVREIFPEWKHG